jgi:hypothetical protein
LIGERRQTLLNPVVSSNRSVAAGELDPTSTHVMNTLQQAISVLNPAPHY